MNSDASGPEVKQCIDALLDLRNEVVRLQGAGRRPNLEDFYAARRDAENAAALIDGPVAELLSRVDHSAKQSSFVGYGRIIGRMGYYGPPANKVPTESWEIERARIQQWLPEPGLLDEYLSMAHAALRGSPKRGRGRPYASPAFVNRTPVTSVVRDATFRGRSGRPTASAIRRNLVRVDTLIVLLANLVQSPKRPDIEISRLEYSLSLAIGLSESLAR